MPPRPVRTCEKTIRLPGYPPAPPQKAPLFQMDGHTRIYPYPLRDHITFRKQSLRCRALVVENEHLRLTVLPRFGGHLWSLHDKRRKREVFYTPKLVKPGLIHLSGAWMPAGVEFNFPNGHHPMTLRPVAAVLQSHADGSASITVGDTEFLSRMRWQVTMRLRPGVAALDVETRLANPTPLEQRWYFWANAAVEASTGWQFCCPARYARRPWTGEKRNFPVHQGRDLSRYATYRGSSEVFAAGVAEDFFGCYNHDSGAGVVHIADWRRCFGKKFFTWGSGPEGRAWGRIFCDAPVRQYVEIQCGPLETQADREWFPPRGERAWTERWYPVARSGPFFYATAELALGVRGEGKRRVLTLFPCRNLGTARVEIGLGKRAFKRKVTLRAGRLCTLSCPGAQPFEVRVLECGGRRIVKARYPYKPRVARGTAARLKKLQDGLPFLSQPKGAEQKIASAEHLLLQGERQEALRRLNEALHEKPSHVRGRLLRGQVFLRAGLWGRARVDFNAAAQAPQREQAAEAHYHLGLIERYRVRDKRAEDAFVRAGVLFPYGRAGWARSEQALAELEIARGRFAPAQARLARLCNGPRRRTAERRTLLALVRREQGDFQGARRCAEAVLRTDPLYLAARWERWAAIREGRLGPPAEPPRAIYGRDEPGGPPDPDRDLEMAWWYAKLRRYQMALAVLGASKVKDPRIEYLAAYLNSLAPNASESRTRKHLDRAARRKSDYVFPFRLEELALFDWATKVRPKDARAWRLRGTLLGSFFRMGEALSCAQKALQLEPGDALAWRNAGIAAWKLGRSMKAATAFFEKARALNPKDPDLACELLSMYDRMGRTRQRLALVDAVPPSVRKTHRFRKRILGVLAEAGRHAEVVRMIERYPTVAWEGEVNAQGLYAFCCLQLCKKALEQKRHARAARWAGRAGRYPPTTFAARPARPIDAAWRYWKAVALEAAGRTRAALREYRRAADEADYDRWFWISSEAPFFRALARRRLASEKEACADFRKILRYTPHRELFYGRSSAFADYAEALAHLGLGEREAALRAFQAVLKSGGLRGRAREWLAELRQTGRRPFVWPHEKYRKA